MSTNAYSCPAGCLWDIPDVAGSDCAPEVHFGEIKQILIGMVGHPLTNVSDPAELAARLALPSGDDDRLQLLNVIGDMPAPETSEVLISGCRKVQSPKDFTVNLTIDETNDTNHEFMRWASGCNPTILAWLVTTDHIRGGNEGIEAQLYLSDVIETDCKSVQKYVGKLTWTGKDSLFRSENILP